MATGTVDVAGIYAYIEHSIRDVKVPFVGAYVEQSTKDSKMSFVGAYVEQTTKDVKTMFAGLYVEEYWDGNPPLVSMNSINEIIMGSLLVR